MTGKTGLRPIVIRSCLILVLSAAATVFLGWLFPQLGTWAMVICTAIGGGLVVPMWIEYMTRSRDGAGEER
jgi:hypothetical protein